MPHDTDMKVDVKPVQLQKFLDQWILNQPISHWGAAALETPVTIAAYRNWLKKGYHGKMDYLETHLPAKESPQSWLKGFRSALVFAFPYVPHPKPSARIKFLNVASYARGEDYHFWLKENLEKLAAELKASFPQDEFLIFTDSAPLMERDLGTRAGMGWIGKNSCLLDRQFGSLFLIGEILTTLVLEEVPAQALDFCGTCQACMTACPTGALVAPKVLDANRCISYWTIESREVAPENLRNSFGDLFFGCDICQTVCPWNQKVFKTELTAKSVLDVQIPRENKISELEFILQSSGKSLARHFAGTPFMRAGPFGLKRNALMVIANSGYTELRDQVEAFTTHEKLGELARWTIRQLDGR